MNVVKNISACCLFILLVTQVFAQDGAQPSEREFGVINGVCWALYNLDKPGTFVTDKFMYGMLYHWESGKGWIATDPTTGEVQGQTMDDPCPEGWRMPTIEETKSLRFAPGILCGPDHNPYRVDFNSGIPRADAWVILLLFDFLPTGSQQATSPNGYWSSSIDSEDDSRGWIFSFERKLFLESASLPSSRNQAFLIRCVTDGIHDVFEKDIFETICATDLPYKWQDTVFAEGTETGIYHFQHGKTIGCDRYDTIVHLHLTVNPVYFDAHVSAEICKGETFDPYGFTDPGEYPLQLKTIHGCDSNVTLHLTVNPNRDTTILDTVCQGSNYDKHGFTFSDVQPGLIIPEPSKKPTTYGCDSTIFLYLTVHPNRETLLYDSVCPGETYMKNGFNLSSVTQSDLHTINLKTIYGCDSTITLDLHLHDTYLFPTDTAICEGNTVLFQNKPYDKTGIYYDSLTTVHGCDSIYRLNLTVHPVYSDVHASAEICEGEVFTQHDLHASTEGDYPITLKTIHGCDSLVTLHLTVHPIQETTILDTTCQGDDYRNHGFTLTAVQSGLITPTPLQLKTTHGCDSTVYLHLTVHPKQETLLHDTVCPGEPYMKHGFNLSSVTQSGKHYLRLKTLHGCDSTITLDLHLHDTYLFPTDTAICEGNTVLFQDKPYDKAGTYDTPYTTVHGCDSIYFLHLTVHPVYPDVQVSGVLCEGETFTQYGFNVTTPGEHTIRLTTIHGCDSTITLTLTEEKKVQGEITSLLEDCTTHSYSFLFDPSLPVSTWLWDMGDGKTHTQEEAFHSYADSGTYQVQLHTTTPNDCGNLFSYTQRVPPYLPKIHISADRTLIDEDYPTVRFSAEVLPGMRCLWDFGDGTKEEGNEADGANEVEHTYDITEARIYEVALQVLNEDECLTEATLDIEAVVFPKEINTFTPNGDGINDTFMEGFHIEVFNRSGLRIFAGENGWDGTYKGKQATEDTYFYKLTFRTAYGERTKTGYVVVIR